MAKRRDKGGEAVASIETQQAADSVLNDWPTTEPILNGLVSEALNDSNTSLVETREGKDVVKYRVTRGHFSTEEGHTLSLATRVYDKEGDQFHPHRIIVGGNVGHVAATVYAGHVQNNDESFTLVSKDHPKGFQVIFEEILNNSKSIARREQEDADRLKQYRRDRIKSSVSKGVWRSVLAASIGSGFAFGAPKLGEVINEWDARRAEQAEANRQAEAEEQARRDELAAEEAVAAQAALDQFDLQNPTVFDGQSMSVNERVLVPSTDQFDGIAEMPSANYEPAMNIPENVRTLEAPAVGESVVYQLSMDEGQEMVIAHTGDARLLVTSFYDSVAEKLTIQTLEVDSDLDPTLDIGEIVIVAS